MIQGLRSLIRFLLIDLAVVYCDRLTPWDRVEPLGKSDYYFYNFGLGELAEQYTGAEVRWGWTTLADLAEHFDYKVDRHSLLALEMIGFAEWIHLTVCSAEVVGLAADPLNSEQNPQEIQECALACLYTRRCENVVMEEVPETVG